MSSVQIIFNEFKLTEDLDKTLRNELTLPVLISPVIYRKSGSPMRNQLFTAASKTKKVKVWENPFLFAFTELSELLLLNESQLCRSSEVPVKDGF